MAVVYPLSVMHAKMATDVVRKTRTVRRVIVGGAKKVEAAGAVPVMEVEKEEKGIESSTESISRRDSVEWVDHTTAEWANHTNTSAEEQQRQEQHEDITVDSPILEGHLRVAEPKDITITDASTMTTTALTITSATATISTPTDDPEQEEHSYLTTSYELSHKYKTYRQIYHETLASPEGYLGFYKGFSTVVASAFISRLGLMTVYTLKSLCSSSGTGAFSAFQVFIAQTALSVVTYPLSVVGNRRMIASPGRYTSSWDAAKQIVERHGWQALFRGVEVVVVRSVVLAALSQLLL
ncbi:hypothetical protein BGZ95_003178 [Linnemannia exigua]|uniref:ADP/ATP translocase n=1 Tax=Linnemannia exigua TaxID=604196 RepID=A0AAD4H2X1_9FUNG|nr:hypothetical protein BGZ95_003178 [Linnemannia exigua]